MRPKDPDQAYRAISDFVQGAVARGDAPGVVAAVANRNAVAYIDAFGKRDVAKNLDATPDTIFRIASMTKPVTSLAVMILWDAGAIALDDPVAKHLPDYRQPPVLTGFNDADGTYESRPASRPIMIRHLLTHTSGMAYPFAHAGLSRLAAAKVANTDLPLLNDPGERWTYGASTAVLGRVVAKVSGTSLDAFCQTRIFDPLGMVDTGYAVPAEKRDRVITQHQRDAGGTLVERPNPDAIQSKGRGDDGLFSTARDYLAFLQLFLNGGRRGAVRIASEDAIRLMTANQIGRLRTEAQAALDPLVAREFPLGGSKDAFGFGFQIETPPSDAGMRSPGSLSWSGIFNTYFWVDPARQIAAVVLMQLLPAHDEKAAAVLRGFERLVYRSATVTAA